VNGEVMTLPETTLQKARWHTFMLPINC